MNRFTIIFVLILIAELQSTPLLKTEESKCEILENKVVFLCKNVPSMKYVTEAYNELNPNGVISIQIVNSCIDELNVNELNRTRRIRDVQISYSNISNIPSGAFKSVPFLKLLLITNNRIDNLEAGAFIGLSRLENLFFSSNNIEHLPEGIFNGLSSLKTLTLFENNLKHIERTDFKDLKQLEELTLFDNEIRELTPNMFEGLDKLESLDLSYNQISRVNVDAFKGLKDLLELHLDFNIVTWLPEGIFDDNPGITHLYLGNIKIRNQVDVLKKLTNLEVLD